MAKKTLKAELWDKTQYFLSNFYDRMMHYSIFYDGDIDVDVLRQVIKYIVDKVPVLHSSYKPNPVLPYWKVNENYTVEEMADFEEVENLEEATYDFLKGDFSHKSKLQFRIKVFKSSGVMAIGSSSIVSALKRFRQ